MKILFVSDIHGSSYYMNMIKEKIEAINPELIVLLGDALYHGPRNPLPKDYNPAEVAKMLNEYKGKLIAVRGNCDSEVDQMLIEYPMLAEYSHVFVDNYMFYLTHGHYTENLERVLEQGGIWIQGHTHIPVAEKYKAGYIFNPGSISLPKENHPHTFGLYENGVFKIIDLETSDNRVYMEVDLK